MIALASTFYQDHVMVNFDPMSALRPVRYRALVVVLKEKPEMG